MSKKCNVKNQNRLKLLFDVGVEEVSHPHKVDPNISVSFGVLVQERGQRQSEKYAFFQFLTNVFEFSRKTRKTPKCRKFENETFVKNWKNVYFSLVVSLLLQHTK
jgi:hypothetical protein